MNFSHVHKIQYRTYHLALNAIDKEHRMRAWIFLKQMNQLAVQIICANGRRPINRLETDAISYLQYLFKVWTAGK